ncbi:thiomuracin/GE37468 family thiazolyl RiPP peptide [Nonomuraea sp. NPDC046570]|uniref:thiomuracin/GE37468 family thiazolyl RiPP peptide n=1 Tax=Nonomuraea sp. NPDC046570 TaxID=3155255 RepID=UPI0033C9B32B
MPAKLALDLDDLAVTPLEAAAPGAQTLETFAHGQGLEVGASSISSNVVLCSCCCC